MIRLAISKGRILEEAVQMLSSINIQCKVNPLNSRKLIISTDYEDLEIIVIKATDVPLYICLLYTSPSPRDGDESRIPSSA